MANPNDVFGGSNGDLGYTVKWVSSTASGGDGSAHDNAWTLSEALTNATAGTIVRVQDDGTYTWAATQGFTNDGSGGSDGTGFLAMTGYDNQSGANANGGYPLVVPSGSYVFGDSNSYGVWLEKMEFKDGTGAGVSLGNYVVIYNVNVHDYTSSSGILIGSKSHALWCRSFNNGADGFNISFGSTIQYCVASENDGDGFDFISNRSHLKGSVAHQNGAYGVKFAGGECSITDCILDGNTTAGCKHDDNNELFVSERNIFTNQTGAGTGLFSDAPKLCFDNNSHYYNNGTDATSGVIQSGKTTGDPLYIDLANDDFRLQAGSPCVHDSYGSFFAVDPVLSKGAAAHPGNIMHPVVLG